MKFSETAQKGYQVFVDDSNLTRQYNPKIAKNGKSLFTPKPVSCLSKKRSPHRGLRLRLSKNVCEAKNNGAAGELEGARPASNGISRRQTA